MVKHTKRVAYFLSGMLTACLLFGLITPALATSISKQIEVSTDVSVYVNDTKLDPKDANGNPVDVFVYNGTTYLPVRAICNALNVPVQWDESTKSAYLGEHTPDSSTVHQADILLNRPEKNGFNKETNRAYSTGNIVLSIPSYYEIVEENSSTTLYAETTPGIAMMLLMSTDDISFSTSTSKEVLDLWAQSTLNTIGSHENVKNIEMLDSADTIIAGLPAKEVKFIYDLSVNGEIYRFYYKASFIALINENRVISIVFGQTDNAQYNYFPDFDKIIASATLIPVKQTDTGASQNTNPSSRPYTSTDPNTQPTKPVETAQSRTVYVTPTGKRYHYDSHCNGGSYSPTTLEAARRSGLTPCEKCVN